MLGNFTSYHRNKAKNKAKFLLSSRTYLIPAQYSQPKQAYVLTTMQECAIYLKQMETGNYTREDNGNHREEFNKNIDGWARGILERVAHCIADHGRLVLIAALAAMVPGLDVFLGIVPRAAGVRHKDRKNKSGNE